jgi:oligopeptide/dipeptide ABC transporter ATP-binding protein
VNTTPATPLLQVEDLSKRFGLRHSLFAGNTPGLTAIDRVSLEVRKGQALGLVGESGSGKSTLGRAIAQLVRPDSGRILFRGQELSRSNPAAQRIARQKIQFIFQDSASALSPRRSIRQTLLEPLEHFGIDDATGREARIGEALDTVGLDPLVLERLPAQLSSGQRQRVSIARAILPEPELVIADEAVSALDVSVQAQILELFRSLRSNRGLAFIFISHDLSVIPQVAEDVCVMFRGQVVESAPVSRLFKQAAHPYTRGLIAAIPDPDPAVRMQPVAINTGIARDHDAGGCAFADRCPDRMEKCTSLPPDLAPLEAETKPAMESAFVHHVKCHLYPGS